MKRSVLAMLSVFVIGVATPNEGMSQDAQGPSIDETISFIRKVMENDKMSTVMQDYSTPFNETDTRPILTVESECVLKFTSEHRTTYSDHPNLNSRRDSWADLSKHEMYYEKRDNSGSIVFKDRQGIKSVRQETIYWTSGKKDLDERSTNQVQWGVSINVHGVYAERIDKALKHLSKVCFDKYGTEDDDPFQ